jgi:hypothetical protein
MHFVQVTVRNLAIGLIFQSIDQGAHVMRIIQVIITKITDIFTMRLGKCFIEGVGLTTILLSVYK